MDPECLADGERDFSERFADAEAESDCFTTGDEAAIEAMVDALVDDVVMDLRSAPSPSSCAKGKLGLVGNKVSGKLNCWANAADDGLPVSPGCLTDKDENLAQGFAGNEEKPDCLTTGDEAAIEAKVDVFVDDVVDALFGSPSGAFLDRRVD